MKIDTEKTHQNEQHLNNRNKTVGFDLIVCRSSFVSRPPLHKNQYLAGGKNGHEHKLGAVEHNQII